MSARQRARDDRGWRLIMVTLETVKGRIESPAYVHAGAPGLCVHMSTRRTMNELKERWCVSHVASGFTIVPGGLPSRADAERACLAVAQLGDFARGFAAVRDDTALRMRVASWLASEARQRAASGGAPLN